MKTTLVKESEVTRKWFVVDAADKPVGRLAVEICKVLRGKNKPTFAPHADLGDFVVVTNASKARLSGAKDEQKIYKHYTGYPSGLKEIPAKTVRRKNPERLIMQAVHGMLPKNHLARKLLTRVKVYPGTDHPHVAQQPESIELL